MSQLSGEDLNRFELMQPQEVLSWGVSQFFPRIAIASSFGAEDVVIIDMAVSHNPRVRVITLDTGRLPQETYDLIERVRSRYGIRVESFSPEASAVERMVQEYGPNLFYTSVELRKLCCRIRKVEPLERALAGMQAWVTGLRRGQGVTRTDVKKVELESSQGGRVKINPLADWDTGQVWEYIKVHEIPYNKLHDCGYPSIGCAPCTRAVRPGEDERAGRWWWEAPANRECGLHVRQSPEQDPIWKRRESP